MNLQALLNKTECWAQQELAAQQRMLELLGRQEAAIAAGSAAEIVASGEAIQAHLRAGPARENHRQELVRRFAQAWGVAPGTLTLQGIAERAEAAGLAAGRLRRAREELRDAGASVLRRGRRIAAMARFHQGLLSELLGVFLSAGGAGAAQIGSRAEAGGVLVDQEA
ncbi:MAG: hypothetical protein AB1726_13575 [Planctomycetota bacterium]